MKGLSCGSEIDGSDVSFIIQKRSGGLSRLMGNSMPAELTPVAELTRSPMVEWQRCEGDWHSGEEVDVSLSAAPNETVAAFLCDSFTRNRLAKYFACTFRKCIFKHNRRAFKYQSLVEEYQPNIVFFIIAERLIPYEFNR